MSETVRRQTELWYSCARSLDLPRRNGSWSMERMDICSLSRSAVRDIVWIWMENRMQKEKRSRFMETTIRMPRNGNCIQMQMEVSRLRIRQRKIRKLWQMDQRVRQADSRCRVIHEKKETNIRTGILNRQMKELSQQLRDQGGFIISGYVIRDSILMWRMLRPQWEHRQCSSTTMAGWTSSIVCCHMTARIIS